MECISLVYVRRTGLHVPCGKCLACIEKKAKEWAVRLSSELRYADTAYFITMTYDDENLSKLKFGHLNSPYEYDLSEAVTMDDFSSMVAKIDKSHLSLFLKRLRNFPIRRIPKTYNGRKVSKIALKHDSRIKFFAVGEYGEKSNRAHFHLLLFNFPYNTEDSYEIIKWIWEKGTVHFGTVTPQSIDYTVGYMFKNNGKDSYRTMSVGLGAKYLTDDKKTWHQRRGEARVRINQQFNVMPRYFKDKIFSQAEKEFLREQAIAKIQDRDLEDPRYKDREYRRLQNKVEYKKTKR